MTDYWAGWSADGSDFDGSAGDEFGDPTPEHPDDGGYPVEGFGAADPDPGELSEAPADPPPPLGYEDLPTSEPPRFDPYAEGDPYPPDGSVPEPDSYPDVPAEVGFGSADPPVGADPDLDPYADAAEPAAWFESTAPDLGPPPEPVDGFPWTDPNLLGDPGAVPPTDPSGLDGAAVGPDELADYAGEGLPAGDPWSALVASDDPATSNLARFWSPEDR